MLNKLTKRLLGCRAYVIQLEYYRNHGGRESYVSYLTIGWDYYRWRFDRQSRDEYR